MEVSPAPRLLVAGLSSSVGKTTVASGILGALRSQGHHVAAYKVGPDFLDPHILGYAAGSAARTLDPWLVTPGRMVREFLDTAPRGGRGVSVVEGVMGVLDGSTWGTSSGDVARLLGIPIVLVLDASASSETLQIQARGARAVLGRGLAGVVINRAGRGWHAATARRVVETGAKVPVLGVVPWESSAQLPERHLGLVTPWTDGTPEVHRRVRAAAALVAGSIDLEALLRIARASASLPGPRAPSRRPGPRHGSSNVGVAVALDPAFCFLYPENLEAIEAAGGRVLKFSPLSGDSVPAGAEVVYLPGGYPELHARRLARQEGLRRELRSWVREGRPLWAECGGMMYLLGQLTDLHGRRHRMVGALPGSTSMGARLGGLGYVEGRTTRATVLGPRGTRLRGHLYHHSVRTAPRGYPWALRLAPLSGRRAAPDGYAQGHAFASYVHVRFDGNPGLLPRLLRPHQGGPVV